MRFKWCTKRVIIIAAVFSLTVVASASYLMGAEKPPSRQRSGTVYTYVGGLGAIHRINLTEKKPAQVANIQGQGKNIVTGLWMTPDGQGLYLVGEQFDNAVLRVDPHSLQVLGQLKVGERRSKADGEFDGDGIQGDPGGKRGVTRLFTRQHGAWLQFMDFSTFTAGPSLEGFPPLDATRQAAFSPDGGKLVTLVWRRGTENSLRVLDTATGATIKEVQLPWNLEGNVSVARYLGDLEGLYIVQVGTGGNSWLLPDQPPLFIYREGPDAVIAKVRTGQVLRRLRIPPGRGGLTAVSMSPDGKYIAIARGDYIPRHEMAGELTILDGFSGKLVRRVLLEDGATSNVVFRYE